MRNIFKNLNKRNKRIYWISTVFFVLIIFDSFLIKEIKTERDLTFRNITIKKIENIRHPKGLGKSMAIIDVHDNEFRIILKIKYCLIRDPKKELEPNDIITVGYAQKQSISDYLKSYNETFIVRKNNSNFIDFKCVANDSHFGKIKLTTFLFCLNIAILYILIITQRTRLKN